MREVKRRLKFRGFNQESGVGRIVADRKYACPHFKLTRKSIVERYRLRLTSVSIYSLEHFLNSACEGNDLFLLKP